MQIYLLQLLELPDLLEEVLINLLDLFGLELEQKKKLLQANINLMETDLKLDKKLHLSLLN